MDFPDDYLALLEGETRVPSTLVAVLDPDAGPLAPEEVVGRLSGLEGVRFETGDLEREPGEPDAWRFWLIARSEDDDGDPCAYLIYQEPNDDSEQLHQEWRWLAPGEVERGKQSRRRIGVVSYVDEDPLGDFHRQIEILSCLVDDAVYVMDMEACRPFSGLWLREAASVPVPPPPESLYSVHQVVAEDETCWFHTHGLKRCGLPELEILNVEPGGYQIALSLINVTAKLILDRGMPAANEPFLVGYDMELLWLPWKIALEAEEMIGDELGGPEDRNEFHDQPSAVLYAPGEDPGDLLNPGAVFTAIQHPVFFISSMETQRMRYLALFRLEYFAAVFHQRGRHEDWSFVMKIGYAIDGATDDDDYEHLWFRVHDMGPDWMSGELLNQPYQIERLKQGEVLRNDLTQMSDWQIRSPHGHFDADNVRLLFEHEANLAPPQAIQ